MLYQNIYLLQVFSSYLLQLILVLHLFTFFLSCRWLLPKEITS